MIHVFPLLSGHPSRDAGLLIHDHPIQNHFLPLSQDVPVCILSFGLRPVLYGQVLRSAGAVNVAVALGTGRSAPRPGWPRGNGTTGGVGGTPGRGPHLDLRRWDHRVGVN